MNLGKQIASGNTARIYLSEDKIIKIYHDYLPDNEATYEANKQQFAFDCGLPVPNILEITEVDEKQAIVMEYIQGRTFGELALENKDQTEYYMGISVSIQQKIHSVEATTLEPMEGKLRRQLESANKLTKLQKIALLQKLDSMPFDQKLCHGDYHLFNLLLSDQQVTIIDWVDSSAGTISADVYRTYLLYSFISMDLATLYVNQYCEKSGMLKEEVFQWAPIIAGARLSESLPEKESDYLLEIVNQYVSV
ncbi:phosphotransferase family protein [Ornithinibacillus contaminans]|uniref:phosphotransferase family protein n=1 Tax=Ornithinibacillus contaminans TaxID=694055 RepID=UPI00064D76E7|nr:aminoglycoside phosphotransferase family protein [Ornithinibacillus contaminans]